MARATEVEVDSARIPEIVLIGIIESIAEVGQQIVELHWSNGHFVADGNVNTAAECHGEGIARGRVGEGAGACGGSTNRLKGIGINIGVSSPKQEMREGLSFG